MPQTSETETNATFQALEGRLAEAILSGNGLNLFFDNDGTVCPFVSDPKDVKIDPDCYAALVRLQNLAKVSVTSLTGREVHEARNLMLAPGFEVRNARGGILAEGGVNRLFFTIVGSHGVECLAPDAEDGTPGKLTRYEFSRSEQEFITRFQKAAQEFKEKYPGLTVEIKHGAVGINAATVEGRIGEEQNRILSDVMAGIEPIINDPGAPTTESGQRIFAVRKEGAREMEVRPVVYGKDFGIATFGAISSKKTTVFMCDSLGDEGTDRPAAEMVNHLGNGLVLMVLNGRNEPPAPGSPHAPCAVFNSPADLGKFLIRVAERIEKALIPPAPGPYIPSPQP